MHGPCAFLLAIMIVINIDFMGREMNCCSRELILNRSKCHCWFFRILKDSLDFGDPQSNFGGF